jgi:RimJ/RimL family protein N-acetyltransferase
VPAIHCPILRDDELTLRPGRPEDADAVTAACQDEEIQRWTFVPSPYRHEHAVEWLAGSPERARVGEAANFLCFGADGRLAGSFSIMEIDFERGYGEIGYWTAPDARGRGVATRAVRLLRDWGHRELGLTVLEILTHRDNAAARRVAERAGFVDTGEHRRPPRGPHDAGQDYAVYVWQA